MRPRMQSSLCVTADGARWVLFNASPDVRSQLASAQALWPRTLRASPVEAVVLTNADIDHSAGLLVLREGGAPPIYCTGRVERALTEGLRVVPVLAAYGAVQVRRVAVGEWTAVRDRSGAETGVEVLAFAVASKPPPYMLGLLSDSEKRDLYAGDTVGYVVRARGEQASAVYVPGVKELDAGLRERVANASCVLIDGTFYTDDEMIALGASQKTAHAMGHAPLSGRGGLVEFLDGVAGVRKVLVHINNSNPILCEGSAERAWVCAHDIEIAHDGMEITL